MAVGRDLGRSVALGGFMGAGKSTVGRALADELGVPFLDSDDVLTQRWGPIAEQFSRAGEAVFRDRERSVVRELAAHEGVLATGGGVFADDSLRRHLSRSHWMVTLDVDLDTVKKRLGNGLSRPLAHDLSARFEARRHGYADVDRVVDGAGSARDVAHSVALWLRQAHWSTVALGPRSYPVVVWPDTAGLGRIVRQHLADPRIVLVTDETVGPLWAETVRRSMVLAGIQIVGFIELPAGEQHKTIATWAACVDGILDAGVDRHTTVVALGGGVVGDIAGFAAAAVLRGVPVVHLPTTLLAMVDSAVGGKTGVNHPLAKNLIGAFHQPNLVLACVETLGTLDPRAARSGLGEVVKSALLAGSDLFERVERDADALSRLDALALAPVIAGCARYKATVVAADEREAGQRVLLNLGHTLGHALETAAGHGSLHHGEAVMIGLVAEARFAVLEGVCDPSLPERLARLGARLGLPVVAPQVDVARVLGALKLDKKRRGARLQLPVPIGIGRATCVQLPESRFAELVNSLNGPQ